MRAEAKECEEAGAQAPCRRLSLSLMPELTREDVGDDEERQGRDAEDKQRLRQSAYPPIRASVSAARHRPYPSLAVAAEAVGLGDGGGGGGGVPRNSVRQSG